MSTYKTALCKLNLWEPDDSFVRVEFNENTQKTDDKFAELESQLGQFGRMALGTYVGTGEAGSSFFSLPFQARALLMELNSGIRSSTADSVRSGGLALLNRPTCDQTGRPGLALEATGFRAYHYGESYAPNNNMLGQCYHYIAFE